MATLVTNTSFAGFKNLIETFTIDVKRAERRELNVCLIQPTTTATSTYEKVTSVAIRIELSDGSVGWGEAPILRPLTAEDQPMAMEKVAEACEFLKKNPAMTLGSVLGEIAVILPGFEFAAVSFIVKLVYIIWFIFDNFHTLVFGHVLNLFHFDI